MNMTNRDEYDVIIVGGGFCGTMVAVHLAQAQSGLRIALVERERTVGRGLAYGTKDPRHLLNVRANQMGAFPDDIEHFYRWTQRHPERAQLAGLGRIAAHDFVPRQLYGDYLQDLFATAREAAPALEIIRDELVDLMRADGDCFIARTNRGRTLRAGKVVLALGNFPPGDSEDNQWPWFSNNPYDPEVHRRLTEPGDVLLIGTGLTSLDVIQSVEAAKKEGIIHVLSRSGRFPQEHRKVTPLASFLDPESLPKTARELLRRFREELHRAECRGIDWRAVVDSIRPHTQRVWQNLPVVEQQRFLRHLAGRWDVHRHRCAPEILARKLKLEREGRLVCHTGRILGYETVGTEVEVTYRPRGEHGVRRFRVRRVLSCTGPQADYRKLQDPLVQAVLRRNLIGLDPLNIGLLADGNGQVRSMEGEPIRGLYAVGSLLRGRLYESIAVPELRTQAKDVSDQVLRHVGATVSDSQNCALIPILP
jgi:uncharacterized NAD(P)/FAD-binding protein YdhS